MNSVSAKKPAVYTVAPAPDGYAVLRDGLAATPAGNPLVVPTEALAEAIAEEARRAPSAPLMQLAATAIDIVARNRNQAIGEVISYAESEHLCHRADYPAGLVQEQQKRWQPLLGWLAERFQAPLSTGTGIMPVTQPPESIAALRRLVGGYDDFRLTGLKQAVSAAGSFVLGLAVAEGHLDADRAFEAAELDTSWQSKQWGGDPVMEARRADIKRELALCEKWFSLLGKPA